MPPPTATIPFPPAKMTQEAATEAVRTGVTDGTSVRRLAQNTGWSVGWVSELAKEFRAQVGLPAQQSRDELDSLQECIDSLSDLDDAARRRVLRYLSDRFGAH
ncbi:hypothetical protein HW130_17350 [Streptomyces sp. PKU-EA00015]|uniref:hypothetical protein n=1 Tax=Streptomyces sp. PKU-EA00015 TaxID=2748326 RepID=UPI00159FCB32|nr:hypothetical protein [Streptomyces sp. PKU-EA00015]NWF28011.1 hypothetical protein [Streptomyces sp. PKU-EA00015]